MRYKKLHKDAIAPTRGSEFAAGLDLSANESVFIGPGGRVKISTGIAVSVGDGNVGLVWPRSKLANKFGIQVLGGVIDADYTGEIMVILLNSGSATFEVKKGDRIAQLVVQACDISIPIESDDLGDTVRGIDGINSSDLRL